MIEIKHKDNFEAAELAGKTVADAREMYRKDFSITEKANAFLNGKKVTPKSEAGTVITDNDTLVFKKAHGNGLMYMAGALLLAMAITGGVFAYGFMNATTTLAATAIDSNFASVSANTSVPLTWTARGMEKGSTGSGTLFDINTATSGYNGDLVATVTMANANDMIKVYRNLTLTLELRDSSNNLVDINGDNVPNSSDFVLLTLENGSASLSFKQTAASNYTIKVKGGSYICHAANAGWSPSSGAPMLFCEIAQR